MDYRMDLRLPVHLPAVLATPTNRLHGETVNLSFEGAYVQLRESIPPLNCQTKLCLLLEPDEASVALPAMMVHREQHRLGLVFEAYGEAECAYLSRRLTEAYEHIQEEI